MLFAKKCPLCSTKMSKVNGILTCPICGYNESFHSSSYTTSDSGEIMKNTSTGTNNIRTNTNVNIDTNTGTNTSENSRSIYQNADSHNSQSNLRPYEQYLNQQPADNASGNTSSGKSFAEITAQRQAAYGNEKPNTFLRNFLISLALILIFIGIFVPITLRFFTSPRHKDHTHDSESYYPNAANRAGSGRYSVDGGSPDEDSSAKEAVLTVPQTEFFTQMMCLIFDKDVDDLTASDSEQIISMHIYEVAYDYIRVDYKLADGTSGTVYPANQSPDMRKDLTCFVNVEELYLEVSAYRGLDLSGLEKLHTLYIDGYLDDVMDTINPDQITELGLYDAHFSVSGLSAFTNVETFYLDSTMLTGIDGISELPNLKNLTIMDGDYIDDLSALYKATQLESLSIESNSLRDVSFLTKFDNLKNLTIIGSDVLDFSPLAECTQLESLYLLKNYKTTDYEFVKGLTELKEFGLMTSFNFDDSDMPDLSALNNVTKLYLGNFESFDNLKYMTNVEELTIDDGGYGTFGNSNSLLYLPNLRSLTLLDGSISPEMIQQISAVEGLEYLEMHSSYLWSDISPIINLPNLKELRLNYATFQLDTDNIAENDHLRVLDMGNAKIYKYNKDQWADKENLDVEALQNALANLHGMEELTLEDLKINSVEFAAGMENLKMLNIVDNYVTSLKPLAKLPKLQIVVCETNPISETSGLDDILVK